MKGILILIALTMTLSKPSVLFDFNSETANNTWIVVDDVVMGGESSGSFNINSEGHGVFSGTVSLENNGGFSSVFHSLERRMVGAHQKVSLKIKGDGNRYQFRLKENTEDDYSYVQYFDTNGEWQVIELPFNLFYPSYRGRKLDMPNFSGQQIEEIRFLIGNKKAQSFSLIIDKISVI